MINYSVYNQKADSVGTVELHESVFAVKPNNDLLNQAVVAQSSNERQVLAHTKDRSEVRGGGRKPWKQKGTGRARAGSNRSPIWIGGGITFGPRNERNFSKQLNKKMRVKAMLMVLSDKVENKNLVVLDKLEIAEYKTKLVAEILKEIDTKVFKNEDKKRSVLIINNKDSKLQFSGRNLTGVEIINIDNINILDLLKYKKVIISKDLVLEIDKRYSKALQQAQDKESEKEEVKK